MSNLPPPPTSGDQPWGAPAPGGAQQPWGAPPAGAQPPPYGSQQPPSYGGQPPNYGGQQLPPYGQFGTSQANWAPTASAVGELALWGPRALAWLIDAIFVVVPWIVLYILTLATGTIVFEALDWLWSLGVGIWFAIQVGQSGSSPGMRVIGLKCVKEDSGQLLGGGMGFVRALIHSVASVLCFVPYIVDMLFPLWDPKRQTLADKIVSTVVVKVPPQGFSLVPKVTS